jgi:hypothetical protein
MVWGVSDQLANPNPPTISSNKKSKTAPTKKKSVTAQKAKARKAPTKKVGKASGKSSKR